MNDFTNMKKYFIILAIVSISTKIIPTCNVLQSQAIYIGLIAATTFALLDIYYPSIIISQKEN